MKREYTVIVEQGENGYLIGSVPALPGCHTQGRSLGELLDHMKEAIELVFDERGGDVAQEPRRTDIGATEGRLETISLAGRPIFNVRDELFGNIVTCAIGKTSLDELKEGLGRRVLVHGEITYDRNGLPSGISPVFSLDILNKAPSVTIGDIIGIGVGLPGSDLSSEQYVKSAWNTDSNTTAPMDGAET